MNSIARRTRWYCTLCVVCCMCMLAHVHGAWGASPQISSELRSLAPLPKNAPAVSATREAHFGSVWREQGRALRSSVATSPTGGQNKRTPIDGGGQDGRRPRRSSWERMDGVREPHPAAPDWALASGSCTDGFSPAALAFALPQATGNAGRYLLVEMPLFRGRSVDWAGIIQRASQLHGLPPQLIAAVIRAESNFRLNAVSPKGAQGVMQIMPGTQRELGLRNPFDPEANVLAGSRYLKSMLLRFGRVDLALAAYNAGPAAVRGHGGIPPYSETRQYVQRVQRYLLNGQTVPRR